MYECIKPLQFVKSHERDYLIFKGDRFYINTYYAGIVEITKTTFEKLKDKGWEIRDFIIPIIPTTRVRTGQKRAVGLRYLVAQALWESALLNLL